MYRGGLHYVYRGGVHYVYRASERTASRSAVCCSLSWIGVREGPPRGGRFVPLARRTPARPLRRKRWHLSKT